MNQKLKLLNALQQKVEYKKYNAIEFYKPYKKQKEFHALGATKRERLFKAGNQLGKTLSGGYEVAYHLTGLYPDWWEGRRFDEPTKWWVAGESGESTRDNPQKILLGEIGELGTGTIPKECIARPSMARGVANLVDHVAIKHVSGQWSHLFFKSYGKGREKWQGATLHGIWFDEEPDIEIYSEGLTRTNVKLGSVIITFTPLKGQSRTVYRFTSEPSDDRVVVNMSIWEVVEEKHSHLSEKQAKTIVDAYPEHERNARAFGDIMLGEGAVFPISEELIKEPTRQIPDHWPRICGIDFGWDHPTACVWLAHDKENDTVHVYGAHRESKQLPIYHAAVIKERGNWIPVSWPLDGLQTEKGTGKQLKNLYLEQGVKMLFTHAKYEDDRGNQIEPGIHEMFQRMKTGRFKVDENLHEWFEEFRMYHRKNGKVVTQMDDLMAATRYALMMIKHAKTKDTTWEVQGKIVYPDLGIV